MHTQPVTSYPPSGFAFVGEVPEKVCIKCDEGWPADSEFFFSDKRKPDGLMSICKACYNERPCMVRRKQKAVSVLEECGV